MIFKSILTQVDAVILIQTYCVDFFSGKTGCFI